jgi:hypothetical protein
VTGDSIVGVRYLSCNANCCQALNSLMVNRLCEVHLLFGLLADYNVVRGKLDLELQQQIQLTEFCLALFKC